MRRFLLLVLACLFIGLPAWAMTVDLNTATQAELETLPGIGPTKAADILAWRAANGPFTSPAQLDDVPGIGPATLSRLLPLVSVGGVTTPAVGSPAPTAPAPSRARTGDLGLVIQAAPPSSGSDADASEPSGLGSYVDLDEPTASAGTSDRGRVDVNSASASELMALPGIGASKAALIVASREQQGPFSSCSDLQRVNGIGPKTVENLAAMCSAGGGGAPRSSSSRSTAQASSPAPSGNRIDINSATAAQLDALPGIGASKAAAIVADREQNGLFSSCSDLERVVGIGATTVANLEAMCVAR